jgi:RNA polymerase sigma-70 factor, ECF subfamily
MGYINQFERLSAKNAPDAAGRTTIYDKGTGPRLVSRFSADSYAHLADKPCGRQIDAIVKNVRFRVFFRNIGLRLCLPPYAGSPRDERRTGGRVSFGRTDQLLVAGSKGSETEQFLNLLGAHERSLFAYVYSLAPNWQDAEEVMQRVRIRIWQQFDQYDREKPFDAWARAIAYYLVLAYRKEKSRQREFFTEHVLEAIAAQFESHLEESSDRRDALSHCLNKLEGRKRELVTVYYSSARQTKEAIASTLSLTPNALRQSLFRIRRALLECVERTIQAQSRHK